MNNSYYNFFKNKVLSSKPSTTIRLLLMVLFVSSFSNVASAVNITITANTNWSAITGGSGIGGLPNNSDDIVVRGNAILTVNVNNAICASLQLGGVTGNNSGTLTFSTATVSNPSLTVTGLVRAGGAGNANRDGIITFINGSTLTAGSLTLGNSGGTPGQGTVTMSAGSIMNVGLLSVINAGHTWTPGSGTVVMTATNTLPNTIFTSFNNLTVSAGTTTAAVGFSVAGILNLAASTTLNMSTFAMTGVGLTTLGTGVLRVQNISGTPLPTGRTWSGTVQYDGVGQSVMVGTYNNLTLSGSGTKAAAGNIIVNNDFTLTAGTFILNNATSYSLTIVGNYLQTGGLFDFNSGTSGTSTMNLSGNLTNAVATTDSMTTSGSGAPNGQIVFNGSVTQNITYTVPSASIWTTYTINASSTVKLASNITLKGDSSDPKYYSDFIVNGILDFGNFILNESSTNGSHFTLNSGGGIITANPTGITSSGATGSIQVTSTRNFSTTANYTYNGSSAQVTGNGLPSTVSNLTINNSAGVTLGQATIITNNFYVTAGSKAYLGNGLTHTAGTVTLAGVAQVPESWGATISPADNKNDIYFAATTGVVNNSCAGPSITAQPTALTICENTGGSFSVATSASTPTYQWQYSGDNINWTNIDATLNPNPPTYVSGFTSNTLILTNTPAAWTNNYVRCIVRSSTGCRTNSISVLLTVNSSPATTAVITPATCNASDGAITVAGLENVPIEFKNTDSDYIDLGNTYLSNRTAFTVEGWIKFKIADLAGTSRISLFGQNDVVEFGFINPTTIELYTAGGGSFTTPIPATLGNNTWHHIAAVGNGTNMIIYIDGVSVATGGFSTVNYGSNIIYTSKIGAGVIDATGGGFTGQIKKVGFYNTALPAATIISLASMPTTYTGSEPGLLAGYNFSEGVGTTLTKVPTGTNGTFGNSPQWIYTYAWTKTGTPAYTASTKNISVLSSGEYNLSVGIIGTSCTKTTSYSVSPTNVYNTSWSLGTPTANQNIEFTGSYSDPTDITACSCTVTSGTVTIPTGNNLILGGKLTVIAPGTLTFEDTSSLVQSTSFTGANTGNITYKRQTTKITKMDYTYWSTPVMPFTLGGVSPNTLGDKFYSFKSSISPDGDWQQESAATPMVPGVGYIIRGPQTYVPPIPASTYEAPFYGVPTNGNQSVTGIIADKSYLLGNPYPSAIDADKFLQANVNTLGGTLYFWTHNTAMQNRNLISSTAGSGDYAYTSNDYATYNATGGVGAIDSGTVTGSAPSDPNHSVLVGGVYVDNGVKPTGKIAAGQGFFASSLVSPSSTTVVFNNIMRLAGTTLTDRTGTNQQFFKTKNSAKTTNAIEKDRIWLNLSNDQGAFKQTLVGYITDATNDYDSRFDGESFDGNDFVDFYSINEDKYLTIQGRALPFDENDEVPLGFRSTIEGSFSISIDQVDGSMTNQDIFIEDKLTNSITDLKAGNYTFNTAAGTFNNRFVLRYNSKTLGITDLETQTNKVVVSVKNKQIKINSLSETINKVAIFDLLGRQIYQNNKVDSSEFLTVDFSSSHQALIVKTTLQNGQLVTNKIIF